MFHTVLMTSSHRAGPKGRPDPVSLPFCMAGEPAGAEAACQGF